MPKRKARADGRTLRRMYEALYEAYGPQGWWPAQTPTEVVIGAILTQNTSWKNVEKAIGELKSAGLLSFPRLDALPEDELAQRIRASGTHRVKARRLKAVARWLCAGYDGRLDRALAGDLSAVRRRILSVHGIGPETADAILLYAGRRPTFVVDAYTRRVLRRHGFIEDGAGYERIRHMLEARLPADNRLFNEFHALFVELGKRHCRARAKCDGCPLASWPHDPDAA